MVTFYVSGGPNCDEKWAAFRLSPRPPMSTTNQLLAHHISLARCYSLSWQKTQTPLGWKVHVGIHYLSILTPHPGSFQILLSSPLSHQPPKHLLGHLSKAWVTPDFSILLPSFGRSETSSHILSVATKRSRSRSPARSAAVRWCLDSPPCCWPCHPRCPTYRAPCRSRPRGRPNHLGFRWLVVKN